MASKEQAARNLEAAVARGLKRRGLKNDLKAITKALEPLKAKRRPKYDPLARENLERTYECYRELIRMLDAARGYCEAPGQRADFEVWGQERIDIMKLLLKAEALGHQRLRYVAGLLRGVP